MPITVEEVVALWNRNKIRHDLIGCYRPSPDTRKRIESLIQEFPESHDWQLIINGTSDRYKNCISRRPSLDLITKGGRAYRFYDLGMHLEGGCQ